MRVRIRYPQPDGTFGESEIDIPDDSPAAIAMREEAVRGLSIGGEEP